MKLIKQIPNLLTLGNLFCGTIATIFAVQGNFEVTALFVVLGIVFDFFDGFAARLLNVSGDLGTQLDSLADMVTSGVVPGIVMASLLSEKNIITTFAEKTETVYFEVSHVELFSFFGLVLTLGACYRLAKFNIDTRQSESFIGLPTPAMSLFVISLPLILAETEIEIVKNILSNNYFLIAVTILLTYLMNAEIPLFSLKFKNYKLKDNVQKYSFLLACIILIATLKIVAIPLIIILYVTNSIIGNYAKK